MKKMSELVFEGERALFRAEDIMLEGCTFQNGESPLKHSRNIRAVNTVFKWKYPVWYSQGAELRGCTFDSTARAGIWYSSDITVADSEYHAPKGFRRCRGLRLENVAFTDAAETLWHCSDVSLENITAAGDYFCMNSENIQADGLVLNGNYGFDGARNVHIRNSRLICKDAFWNSSGITAENCYISGEYLGWNSEDLTFINCTIESLQGLCFIKNLVMKNCRLVNTNLAFEYSTVDAQIEGSIDSIKNPSGGRISAGSIGEIILENDRVDVSATEIVTNDSE